MGLDKLPSIKFGTDGWRGIIADDFTGANVRLVAKAFVDFLSAADVPGDRRIFVGYDNRSQSEYFAREAAAVAAANGFETILSNTSCSSPSVSFNCKTFNAKGGIMITASHNPPQFNGLKIKMGFGGSARPQDVARAEQSLNLLREQGVSGVEVTSEDRDKVSLQDFRIAYFSGLRNLIDVDLIGKSNFTAVVDSMHGSGAGYIPAVLSNSGFSLTEIRTDRNPVFGGVNPEPIEQNLKALQDAVREHAADVGLAIDGDADRVGAVDSRGNFVDSHRIFAITLRHLYEDRGLRGSVVKTVSTTTLIDKMCRKYGLTLHVVPIGFKNIGEWMLRETVLIGGEESGGIGVEGFIPERDGPMMSLMLLEAMAARNMRLEDQIDELMAEYGPHEYQRVDKHLTPNKMHLVVAKLADTTIEDLAGNEVREIDRMDGTKFGFDNDAWLLLRPSGTEPVVRIYAEAPTLEQVHQLISAGLQLIDTA